VDRPRGAARTNGLLVAAALMAAGLWASGVFAAPAPQAAPGETVTSLDLPADAAEPADRVTPAVPTIGGCSVFLAGNPWNQDISQFPLHARSAQMISTIQSVGGDNLHPDFGSNPDYGIPYVVVPADQPLVPITYEAYGDESDPGPFPIPLDAPVEAGSDAHLLVVRQGACDLFELYVADRTANGWSADSGARWDLTTGALRPIGWTSADAAGLPILPGLVRFDEVQAGVIRHAIRVTFSKTQRGFVLPATHFASSDTNPDLPAMGQRLRLRADYDISGLTGASRVIAVAMQTYGLIVADNGSNWFFQGSTDPRWDDDDLNQLKRIPGTAFEVVDSGPVRTR
jgi:hypothetical protein